MGVEKPRYSAAEREWITEELESISKLQRKDFWRLNGVWQEIYFIGNYKAAEKDEKPAYTGRNTEEDAYTDVKELEEVERPIVRNAREARKEITLTDHDMEIITDVFAHSDADLRSYTAIITLIGLKGYIIKNCKKYTSDPGKIEDMIQQVSLVIFDALETYDSKAGKLTTHFQSRINKALEEEMRKLDAGKITNRTQDDVMKVINRCYKWFKDNGESDPAPSPAMIAACAKTQFGKNISPRTVENALKNNRKVVSMDKEEDPTKSVASHIGNPENEYIQQEGKQEFYRAVDRLDPLERCAIYTWLDHYQEKESKGLSKRATLALIKTQFPDALDTEINRAMDRAKKKMRALLGRSRDYKKMSIKPAMAQKDNIFFQQEAEITREAIENDEGFFEAL